MIYIKLLLIAAIVVFIVDLSGFTETWRGWLSRLLRIEEKSLVALHPFDCSLCSTWWACIITAAVCGEFSILAVFISALLAYLTPVIRGVLSLLREGLLTLIDKIFPNG